MLFLLGETFRLNLMGTLRGLKDTRFPMITSFIALWLVGFPVAYCLAFFYHLRGIGLLLGLLIGSCSGSLILWARLQKWLKQSHLSQMVTSGTLDPKMDA